MPAATPIRWALRALRLTLDVGLLVVVCFMAWMLVHRAAESASLRADRRIVAAEARRIYAAFQAYYDTNRSYPNSWIDPAFRPDTLDPLRRLGYYRGYVTSKLYRGRVDAYESPDDRGPNQEFWLEMSLDSDPGVRFLVARSDDAPLGGGRFRDGAFIYRNGSLERI